ncbi:hypothetical protein PORY_000795 [Pneumocystis oryctolagi]|uniref:Uncharacterized protein n=1 Tax=Pneumocystis oryctolagi TaxID=42067 RepID=A0ACB7CEE8_9ASCO|nr:hypothetical protein PORY_000795 [Pneumocystis oryctolagi]
MSWNVYIDNLVGNKKISKAAIVSREGDSVWAASLGFNVGLRLDLNELKNLAIGFDDATQILGSGFYLSKQKYVTIRAEDRNIYGKQGSEGVYCVRTKKTIIIACFPKTTLAGEAAKIVESLGDYLVSVGEKFTDVHRAFLQCFISRKSISQDQAINLLLTAISIYENIPIDSASVDVNTLELYISSINNAIIDFDLEIRKTIDQFTGIAIWILINTSSDVFSQLSTNYTPSEIEFFKQLLDYILVKSNTRQLEVFAITSSQALKESSVKSVGLSKASAEASLAAFVEEGWLLKTIHGTRVYFTLSPRSLLELYPVIKMYIDDSENNFDQNTKATSLLKRCKACHNIVTRGFRCSNINCPIRFHEYCSKAYMAMQKDKLCPCCGEIWSENDFVGDKAAEKNIDI